MYFIYIAFITILFCNIGCKKSNIGSINNDELILSYIQNYAYDTYGDTIKLDNNLLHQQTFNNMDFTIFNYNGNISKESSDPVSVFVNIDTKEYFVWGIHDDLFPGSSFARGNENLLTGYIGDISRYNEDIVNLENFLNHCNRWVHNTNKFKFLDSLINSRYSSIFNFHSHVSVIRDSMDLISYRAEILSNNPNIDKVLFDMQYGFFIEMIKDKYFRLFIIDNSLLFGWHLTEYTNGKIDLKKYIFAPVNLKFRKSLAFDRFEKGILR